MNRLSATFPVWLSGEIMRVITKLITIVLEDLKANTTAKLWSKISTWRRLRFSKMFRSYQGWLQKHIVMKWYND